MLDGKKNGVWKEFSQDGVIQKVGYYYNDSLIHQLNPQDFVLVPITFNGCEILLPIQWNIKKDYKQALVLAVKPEVNYPETFNPTINVVSVTVPDSMTLEQIVDANLEEIKHSVEMLKVKETEKTGKTIKALYFVKANNQKLGVLSAYITDNETLWIVTCMAQGDKFQFVKYKELFEEVILTFKKRTSNGRNYSKWSKMGNN